MNNKEFFRKEHRCINCGCLLPDDYRFELCARCEENELFSQVRDYIRENTVTETQVAQHFNLSLRKIHAWIREGRIEYKVDNKNFSDLRCKKCGKRIPFGEYCVDCLNNGDGQITYLNKDVKIGPTVW